MNEHVTTPGFRRCLGDRRGRRAAAMQAEIDRGPEVLIWGPEESTVFIRTVFPPGGGYGDLMSVRLDWNGRPIETRVWSPTRW